MEVAELPVLIYLFVSALRYSSSNPDVAIWVSGTLGALN
jgi:hypothetical protein